MRTPICHLLPSDCVALSRHSRAFPPPPIPIPMNEAPTSFIPAGPSRGTLSTFPSSFPPPLFPGHAPSLSLSHTHTFSLPLALITSHPRFLFFFFPRRLVLDIPRYTTTTTTVVSAGNSPLTYLPTHTSASASTSVSTLTQLSTFAIHPAPSFFFLAYYILQDKTQRTCIHAKPSEIYSLLFSPAPINYSAPPPNFLRKKKAQSQHVVL